jgi:3-oxoacyl-[acyl-carrier-protein] synthase II
MGQITSFDANLYGLERCVVANVSDSELVRRLGELKARGIKTPKKGRFRGLVLATAAEALQDAGLSQEKTNDGSGEVGIILGTMAAGASEAENIAIRTFEGKKPRVSDNIGKRPGIAIQDVGAAFGLQGPMFSIDSACASGASALIQAFRMVESGAVRYCLAGGAEASLIPSSLKMVHALGVIPDSFSHEPNTASRPFDRGRDGYIPAEGACMLVVEEEKQARSRGGRPYARIIGFSERTDFRYPTKTSAEFVLETMRRALAEASVPTEVIGWVNAHATSTRVGDAIEAEAIHSLFGNNVWTSAPKSLTGHLLGASGAFEAAFSALSLRDQIIPPTVNLDDPDPACRVCCTQQQLPSTFDCVISNSWGFGGSGCCLVLEKC